MRLVLRLFWVVSLVGVLVLGWRFAAANSAPVPVSYVFGELAPAPLWLALLVAFAAGAAAGGRHRRLPGAEARPRDAALPQDAARSRGRGAPAAQPAARDRRADERRRRWRAARVRAPQRARPGRLAAMGWLSRAFGGDARAPKDAETALQSALLAVLDRDLDRAESLLSAARAPRVGRRDAVPRAGAAVSHARRDRAGDPHPPEPAAAARLRFAARHPGDGRSRRGLRAGRLPAARDRVLRGGAGARPEAPRLAARAGATARRRARVSASHRAGASAGAPRGAGRRGGRGRAARGDGGRCARRGPAATRRARP